MKPLFFPILCLYTFFSKSKRGNISFEKHAIISKSDIEENGYVLTTNTYIETKIIDTEFEDANKIFDRIESRQSEFINLLKSIKDKL